MLPVNQQIVDHVNKTAVLNTMALWQLMHMMYGYLHVCIPPWLVIKYSITSNE